MKKLILFCFAIFLFAKESSSQIPNADFEDWWYTGQGTILADWQSFYPDFGIPCLSPDSEAYSGDRAARFNNYGIASYAYTKFPVTSKPLALTAFIKANVASGDSISIRVVLYQSSQAVDSGKWVGYFSFSSYTEVTVLISNTNASADSALIDIRGGNNQATGMLIDHLEFDFNLQVPDVSPSSAFSFSVAPNPFSEVLNVTINSLRDEVITLKLTDAEGRAVMQFGDLKILKGANSISLNTTGLAAGIYHCMLFDKNQHASVGVLKVK
ncbi:MAG TPA: T9SS type A sorting domain-containing protein [Chitinophagales bacterium]|nr:T9SS type A sorting domain-containing protein [Chitinophagales bacterium]